MCALCHIFCGTNNMWDKKQKRLLSRLGVCLICCPLKKKWHTYLWHPINVVQIPPITLGYLQLGHTKHKKTYAASHKSIGRNSVWRLDYSRILVVGYVYFIRVAFILSVLVPQYEALYQFILTVLDETHVLTSFLL